MTDCIICDIDGTLADLSHRRKWVAGPKREWGKFFAGMADDTPLPTTTLIRTLLGSLEVVFVTARPEEYRAVTRDWLVQNLGPSALYPHLLMRETGDYRPDVVVKREMLDVIRGAMLLHPILVLDDRPSVIEMWKEAGLMVLEIDSGPWERERYAPGTLHVMVGPSCAGKSRFAALEWPESSIVSTDTLRAELCGDPFMQDRNNQVFDAFHAIIRARLRTGLETVADATNIRNRDRRALVDLAPGPVIYHVIDRPLHLKRRDAGWRATVKAGNPPTPLIEYHQQIFESNLKSILEGDSLPQVYVLDHRKDLENDA